MSGCRYLSIVLNGPELLIPPLDRAQIFPQEFFLVVAMEWLLCDEDVWSPVLEYRLKRAISFDPTIGLHSKISRGYFPWSSYGMATR
jgi:hypothetical protein